MQCESFNDTEESRTAGSDAGLYCDYGIYAMSINVYIIFLTT